MTQHAASHINHTLSSSTSRNSRRAGLAALAALGLPLGAMLAPTTAAAAPGDSYADIDILLPLDQRPLNPADLLPQFPQPVAPEDFIPVFPVFPTPVPPIPIPFPADDGPGLPFELPQLDDPFDLVPFDPSDFVLPTDPGDDDEEDEGDDEVEPECAEYAASNFDVDAEHHEGDLIELRLVYSDMDVCDFTVWTAVAEPGAAGVLGENIAGMANIAFATDSAGYYQQTLSHHGLCDLEIRVAVEESLAFTIPHTDPVCETGGEDEIPGDDAPDDDDDTPDDGDDTPDDGDDTPDDGDDTPDDGDDTPDDGDDTPEEARPLGAPQTPGTPSGGLPQTGTDLTTVMLALGLITVGAGSIVALATRRREELPTA